MTKKNPSVGILGAGISGLSLAYALNQKNIDTTVYEKTEKVGGAINTIQKGNWRIEEGPNTLMIKSQDVWDLLDELHLTDKLQEANPAAKKRFVVKDKKLTAVPTSVARFLTTPLLSTGAKFRLLKEPLAPSSSQDDESIATFIERRLGKQPLDYGVNPFVSGIYAGDPKELSIKHTFSSLWDMEQNHGSLTKGLFNRGRSNSKAKRALISFKDGTQALPQALANSLGDRVQLSTEITSIKKEGGQWTVKGDGFEATHNCLVSTIPAYTLAQIFDSTLSDELGDIPYAPMSVLALGFENDQVAHPLDGFGMLIPEVENFNLLGCLFSSTLFPNRAPEGHHLLTCFIGGARNPELAMKSQKELEEIALEELNELLAIEGKPVFAHHKHWSKAIPQYVVGYDHFLSLMKEIERQHSGLYLDGNFRHGVSVPDCISSGFKTAQKVEAYLKSK